MKAPCHDVRAVCIAYELILATLSQHSADFDLSLFCSTTLLA